MSDKQPMTVGDIGCGNMIVATLMIVVFFFALFQGIADHFELRDLQRRVAELETSKEQK